MNLLSDKISDLTPRWYKCEVTEIRGILTQLLINVGDTMYAKKHKEKTILFDGRFFSRIVDPNEVRLYFSKPQKTSITESNKIETKYRTVGQPF